MNKRPLLVFVLAMAVLYNVLGRGEELLAPRVEYPTTAPFVVHLLIGPNRCSGFVLRKGVVITAGHCVNDRAPGTLITASYFEGMYEAMLGVKKFIYEADTDKDIAVLVGETPPPSLPDFSTKKLEFLTKTTCIAVGYRAGSSRQLGTPCLVLTPGFAAGLVIPGNSGGPVISMNKELIGMVVRSYGEFPVFDYIPLKNILEYVDKK